MNEMIAALQQFVQYNLLPALVAGAVAWVIVQGGIHLLQIRMGKLRMCLLLAPLVKSTLVLLGLALVLPWPRDVFTSWQALAVPPEIMIPLFLAATGAAVVGRAVATRRAVAAAVEGAVPAERSTPALVASMERVRDAYRARAAHVAFRCELPVEPPRPRLMVTDRPLRSPLVTTESPHTIVFPRALVETLDDDQLDGALAHEVAHLYVRTPWSCLSSEVVRGLVAVNPMATLMAAQLHREEEKACDDIAVQVVGGRDRYAAMLLESYRYATRQAAPFQSRLQYLPQLLGVKPMLSERIERLIDEGTARDPRRELLAFAFLWLVLATVVFQS